MSAVAAPADRRFRRSHVKPGRKKRDWRSLVRPTLQYGLLLAAAGYGVYRTSTIAAYTNVLPIEHIHVVGNERLSTGEVLAMLDGLNGQSIVWTDLDAWRRRLLASPWVRDAALRRSLPSTVEVLVSERQPMGIGRIAGEMYLVDERGVIIDQYGPHYADFDLPIVDGLTASPNDGGALTDEARADLAARVIASLKAKPAIARRLSQVDVSDLHNASVILNGDPAVIQLGEDQFLGRLSAYLDLASALRERVADIDYVDLRFDDRIYVKPAFASSALRRGKPAARREKTAIRRDKSVPAPSAPERPRPEKK